MCVIRLTKALKPAMLVYCHKLAPDQREHFWYPAVIRAL
ncbi:hypothetical protein I551_6024 [Mycobacterium ulcerans str. Harvey]|uniref:Uncharacterized protein n=1 Tax=Mycobacterium ulcerans str. Harvey TaxID=1299332 RepID=A0ABN0QS93_MYCUL|nr:hypothetical protein I551_6024 [Mycobacterium ulcerans str. Harvey]